MSNENLTEKTLADVQAGIPARDAEIEALRKENAGLREQLEAIGAVGVKGRLMLGAVSAEPVAMPEGWKLVPVQPTEEMLVNVDEEVGGSCHSCSAWRASEDDCKRVWAAMIEASPIAPVDAQPQPMKVTSHETIDWTEISKRGLLERINREIMHPLGLAVYRCVETGVSGGALVSPDGVWTYEGDSDKAQQVDRSPEMQGKQVDKPIDLQGHASIIFSKAVAWADARVEAALIQEQGKPHGQACDEAAQAHYELVQALRNLQAAQQPVSGADGLPQGWRMVPEKIPMKGLDDAIAWMRPAMNQAGRDLAYCLTGAWSILLDSVTPPDHLPDATKMVEPSGNSGELPPIPEGTCATEVGGSEHNPKIYFESDMRDYARAALAKQDDDKVDEEPIAILHAGGRWEWFRGIPPKEALFSGWRMEVCAFSPGGKITRKTALDSYKDRDGDSEPTPLSRLHFFCAEAMTNKDWEDSQPFFDDVRKIVGGIDAARKEQA